jgi:hypothetical protein
MINIKPPKFNRRRYIAVAILQEIMFNKLHRQIIAFT